MESFSSSIIEAEERTCRLILDFLGRITSSVAEEACFSGAYPVPSQSENLSCSDYSSPSKRNKYPSSHQSKLSCSRAVSLSLIFTDCSRHGCSSSSLTQSPSLASKDCICPITTSSKLLGTLRRTATQLQILVLCLPRFAPRSTAPSFRHLKLSSQAPNSFITLRQLYYTCKPLLHKSLLLRCPQSSPSSSFEDKMEEYASGELLLEFEADISHPCEKERPFKGDSVSPAYVYNCIQRLTSSLSCHREHLFIEAEGHGLFCTRRSSSYGSSHSSMSTALQSLLQVFRAPVFITKALIDSLAHYLDTILNLDEHSDRFTISVVAIEKEGIFQNILHRLDLSNSSCHFSASNVFEPSKKDTFDRIVMDSLSPLPASTSSYKQRSSLVSRNVILFLVCLKGMPDHNTRKLLTLLHRFEILSCLKYSHFSLLPTSSSPKHPSSVRCFVDCNPSGFAIAQCIAKNFGPPIILCALLPSQLHSLPSFRQQYQTLSTRDRSMLSNMLESNDVPESFKHELSLMLEMNGKEELQSLLHPSFGSLGPDTHPQL